MANRVPRIVIHIDGACLRNPGGPGGWAATLSCGSHYRELSGYAPSTTNNRMELQAAIEALSALKKPCDVELYTDSKYVSDEASVWQSNWKANGWRTRSERPIKNEDLWQALNIEASRHRVTWHWLKGHSGHAGNERCDELANAEAGGGAKPNPQPSGQTKTCG